MSDETRDMLTRQVESILETIRDLYRYVGLGQDYVCDECQTVDDWHDDTECAGEFHSADADEYGTDPAEYLAEYPLEVVDERGRPFIVVLGTGGPHVEVVADGSSTPTLVGYWGGEKVTRHDGDALTWFLDSFIERW